MQSFYSLIKPLLFRFDAEQVHAHITTMLNYLSGLPGYPKLVRSLSVAHPLLETTVSGCSFANPVGLAAGFDKNGSSIAAMTSLGFGFLELGTVTPQPQAGNPRPRLFRLEQDQALINRMGFNNAGMGALVEQLHKQPRHIPWGINLGKNKITPNEQATADYVSGVQLLGPHADYLVINISSPNTPGLRTLAQREPLHELLTAVITARNALQTQPPLWLKLSPDEQTPAIDTMLDVALSTGIDGFIISNTTIQRPALKSKQAQESGGLSGEPLKQQATQLLRYVYGITQGKIPLIGVGGISNGDDAYARICAGANLIQVYTGLIYAGPTFIRDINRRLIERCQHDGHASIAAAVGSHVH